MRNSIILVAIAIDTFISQQVYWEISHHADAMDCGCFITKS
ncbi:MAG: hypothetical protein ACRC11_13025 [Xenococcaceae cyanobacterium]